ncbi:helix-turn-helix domain-containing protein [Streptomyces sp. ODS28]|uniref:PucR family transcriptional regulator n=1 Tax=Streptomyces sp. ODS28 TaxID=3136688 RepID=UPI0031EF850C
MQRDRDPGPDGSPAPFTVNGVPVHERLLHRMPQLHRAVIDTILEQVPYYRELPHEELDGDIRRVARESLRTVATLVHEQRRPVPGELAWFAESAARRAEEGVPLDMVLDAYHAGLHEGWRLATADARPGDAADLRAVTDLVLGFLRELVRTVSAAYNAELRAMFSEEQGVQHTLLSALLGGEPAGTAAERAGVPLPEGYLVFALSIGAHEDERDEGVRAAVAARRKLRRMHAELGRFAGGRVLARLGAAEGTVLVPGAEGVERRRAELDALVGGLAKVAGAEITAGVCHAAPDGVAEAAVRAREIVEVVRLTGRPAGLYGLPDVLLDYQLSRSTAATPELAALLAPLEPKPELLRTLRVHLANGLSRRDTAAALHLHPNTVDYRLRRVAALTGLDTGTPGHLPLITAALTAQRAAGAAAPRAEAPRAEASGPADGRAAPEGG